MIQWNLKSIKSNFDNLKILIHNYSPDLVLLNETFLKPSYKFYIKNYIIYRQDRQDGYGGIAILIKDNIFHNCQDLQFHFMHPNFQGQSIKVWDHKIEINIVNIYNPPNSKISSQNWETILKSIDSPLIVMGDLNSHHTSWGSKNNDSNGKVIINSLEDFNLVLLNTGKPTRISLPNQHPSAVDLTLVSNRLASKCTWDTILDCGSSDHLPIICELDKDIPKPQREKENIYNYKRADWEIFNESVEHNIQTYRSSRETSVDKDYDYFEEIIINAKNQAIPLINPNKQFKRKISPWWDDQCTRVINDRTTALILFKASPNTENYINLKKYVAKAKKFLKNKKKQKFKEFVSSLNRNTPISKIWETVKKFSFAKGYISNSRLPNSETSESILEKIPVSTDLELLPPSEDFEEVNPMEFQYALELKKDTSPGLDGIPYLLLKRMPTKAKIILVDIFNKCLRTNQIPEKWKRILIVPMLKANKNAINEDNYRHIALSPCICKIMESIIKVRIEWTLENSKVFPPLQIGFRKGKGCYEAISIVFHSILNAFGNNNVVMACFIDIKNAYNNVKIDILHNKLLEMNVPEYWANTIYNLLVNRRIYVKDNLGIKHGPKNSSQGLAQGSPLSPLLFNVYTATMHKIETPGIKVIQYADDLVFLIEGSSKEQMACKLNEHLQKINRWLESHNLNISIAKSACILFRRGNSKAALPLIKCSSQTIEWKGSIKYLGVIFTANLKWTGHAKLIEDKIVKGINIMRAICGTKWGADPITLLNIYKGIIRPYFDYACQVFKPSSQKFKLYLDKLQYKALRVILGCMKSTPVLALLSESGEMSLHSRRCWLSAKFFIKTLVEKNNPLLNLVMVTSYQITDKNKYWSNKETPYLVEAAKVCRKYTDNIYRYDISPYFETEITLQIPRIKCLMGESSKKVIVSNQEFINVHKENFPNHEFIFTDGSVNPQNNSAGYGVHFLNHQINYAARLHDFTQICTAEIIGIHKAILMCLEKDINKAIVFTDSQSAIKKIQNKSHKDTNYISVDTKRILIQANAIGKDYILAWCPGHSNITGNIKADHLAKFGSNCNIPENIKLDKEDLIPILKNHYKDKFHREWKRENKRKHTFYSKVQEDFPLFPWFRNICYKDRRHITTIIRIRTGHSLTPLHMFKIGIRDNPFCECGQVGGINHVILECKQYNADPNALYNEFIKCKIPSPLSILSLIIDMNQQAMDSLMKYLISNQIIL